MLAMFAGCVALSRKSIERFQENYCSFSVKKIFSHRLPVDWNEQRKFLGLPEKDYAAK